MTVANYNIARTLRELGNRVADALAKMGIDQETKLVTPVITPERGLRIARS